MKIPRSSFSATETPARTAPPNELGHAIRLCVYELFEQCGKVPGRAVDDWLQAEAKPNPGRKAPLAA
jgi:hypothetical protein